MKGQSGIKLAEVQSESDVLIVRGEFSGAIANALLVYNLVGRQEHVSEAALIPYTTGICGSDINLTMSSKHWPQSPGLASN